MEINTFKWLISRLDMAKECIHEPEHRPIETSHPEM